MPQASGLPVLLLLEFATLFLAGPALLLFEVVRLPLIPTLIAFAVLCLAILLLDRSFDRSQLWNARTLIAHIKRILLISAIPAAALFAATAALAPDLLFNLPRNRPGLWAIIMAAYPVFSVYPQEIIYRTFIFHRYRAIFTTPRARIIASAAAFGWAHVIFRDPYIAVGLTLIGGAMFATTYHRTRSTLMAAIQHALFGCLIFTIGLGSYFYNGAR